jgi:hypothetical protein
MVDSGSSTSSVNAKFVQRARLPTTAANLISVKVANCEFMQSDTQVYQLARWMQRYTFALTCTVLDMDWLEDWILKLMDVPFQGKMVRQHGVLPQQHANLALIRWLKYIKLTRKMTYGSLQ